VDISAGRPVPARYPVPAGYELDDDPRRIDHDAVWAFLSTDAYWGQWRERQEVEVQLTGAWRVVGGYEQETGRLVAFARAISDGVSFAYLADVFVLPRARGRGLGAALVQTMIDDGPGASFRWLLHTADAHRLYGRFGFGPPDQTCLERPGRGRRRTPSVIPG
jgi:GNAT superfamily N-acetyltransferase